MTEKKKARADGVDQPIRDWAGTRSVARPQYNRIDTYEGASSLGSRWICALGSGWALALALALGAELEP